MKKLFSILILLAFATLSQAQVLQFPESFKSDTTIFKGMYLYQLPAQTQKVGLSENPAVTTLKEAVAVLVPKKINQEVKAVYYEIYASDENNFSGVYVIQYKSEQALKNILPELKPDERSAYLTRSEYLIIPNSRRGNAGATRIDAMVQYYQKKLGATLFMDRQKNVQYVEIAPEERFTKKQSQEKPKVENRTDYEKLTDGEIKHLFSKETPKHRLGSVTKYSYDSIQKIEKQTNYKAKESKLIFNYERSQQLDHNDSLLYETQYSEIPSDQYPEYILEHHQYNFQDSLTLTVHSINGRVQDSIFTKYKKDIQQRVIVEYTVQKTIHNGVSHTREMNETQYEYNDNGWLTSKTIIENNGDVTDEYRYEYDTKGQLRKSIYSNFQFQLTTTETYNARGQLILTEEKIGDGSIAIHRIQYNTKGLEIEDNKYEGKKLVYQYSTIYDAQQRKIKYIMTDKTDNSSGIWLYEYDDRNRLKYKIDLFWKAAKPANKVIVQEVVPAPVEAPPVKVQH